MLITDGRDNRNRNKKQKYLNLKKMAARRGITVIAIGIGKGVSLDELRLIGSQPSLVSTVEEFRRLGTIISWICSIFEGKELEYSYSSPSAPDESSSAKLPVMQSF